MFTYIVLIENPKWIMFISYLSDYLDAFITWLSFEAVSSRMTPFDSRKMTDSDTAAWLSFYLQTGLQFEVERLHVISLQWSCLFDLFTGNIRPTLAVVVTWLGAWTAKHWLGTPRTSLLTIHCSSDQTFLTNIRSSHLSFPWNCPNDGKLGSISLIISS